MKKLVTILVYVGLAGILIHALLLVFHLNACNSIFLISNASLLLGLLLLPASLSLKFKKSRPISKILLGTFWLGALIITVGQLLRYTGWDGWRTVLNAGFFVLVIGLMAFLVIRLVYKLRITPIGKQVPADTLAQWGMTDADLSRYEGMYNNEKLPLKINVTREGDTLIAQATDQNAFYLEMVAKNEFKYPNRDIIIVFETDRNELTLKQHGGFFPFLKEA